MRICKHVDLHSKQTMLSKGFKLMYENGIPNIENEWKPYQNKITFGSAPCGMIQLLQNIFLCYSSNVLSTTRSKQGLTKIFQKFLNLIETDKYKPGNFSIKID